ncbi:MAG TPA: hypothetical protein VFG53_03395 [Anaeromyxobacter sp.]|nr:hypothetical protein [Anaeromyxobacter sp.]
MYLSLPNGMAWTRITNDYLDRTLKTRSTVRSWRTAEMLAGLAYGVGADALTGRG